MQNVDFLFFKNNIENSADPWAVERVGSQQRTPNLQRILLQDPPLAFFDLQVPMCDKGVSLTAKSLLQDAFSGHLRPLCDNCVFSF